MPNSEKQKKYPFYEEKFGRIDSRFKNQHTGLKLVTRNVKISVRFPALKKIFGDSS
jgi:hypothetical protein